jgi:hypothetical protein
MASNDNDRASTHATPSEGPRSFSVILNQLDDGLVHHECSTKLHALVSELYTRSIGEDRKLSGEITIKLKIDVRKGVADVTAAVDTKLPRSKREPTTVWVTKGGNLTTEVPRQEKLPLRDASAVGAAVERLHDTLAKNGATLSVSVSTPRAKDA